MRACDSETRRGGLILCCVPPLPLQSWNTPLQLAARLGSEDSAALLAGSDDAPPPVWPGAARTERLRADLARTDPSRHRNLLGSALFERIVELLPDWAPKITGMLLETGDAAVLGLLGVPGALERKVEEAVGVLRAAGVMPEEGGGGGGARPAPPVARPPPIVRVPPHLQPSPGGWRGGGGGGALPRVPPQSRVRGAPPPPVPPPPTPRAQAAGVRTAAASTGRGTAAASSGTARR